MRRALVVTAAMCLSFAATGCFSKSHNNNSDSGPAATGDNQTGPAWQLNLKSTCAQDVEDGQCVGKFGFTVAADGHYRVGPGPAGQIIDGTLDGGELAALDKSLGDAGGIQLAEATRAEAHYTATERPESDDTLTLIRKAKTQVIVRNTGPEIYYQTANADAANALHAAIAALAQKYYTLPFPNPCVDASRAVEALYSGLQNCQQDSDCAYVDAQTYEVLPPSSADYVIADNCSLVHPLIVANRAAATDAQGKLLDALTNAQGVCGYEIVRNDCQISGFNASAPAVCRAGKCAVNPTLGSF